MNGPRWQSAPPRPGELLAAATGRSGLTGHEVARRHAHGSSIAARSADGGVPAGTDVLFVVRPDGGLRPVTQTTAPEPGRETYSFC